MGKMLVVFTIIDRGEDKKKIWRRVGTAFVNRDESLNVYLDATPTNGTLHIREQDDNYKKKGYDDKRDVGREPPPTFGEPPPPDDDYAY